MFSGIFPMDKEKPFLQMYVIKNYKGDLYRLTVLCID
jgi:hypothetical protein